MRLRETVDSGVSPAAYLITRMRLPITRVSQHQALATPCARATSSGEHWSSGDPTLNHADQRHVPPKSCRPFREEKYATDVQFCYGNFFWISWWLPAYVIFGLGWWGTPHCFDVVAFGSGSLWCFCKTGAGAKFVSAPASPF